ncbi:Eukaryotic peptide chain release factor GTP-binding subunit ERF3A [Manis javanica]|nr:Eukaryotic peptide chain release factor GTP-binding subunit ERF3A [Manis javanica]
MKFITNCETNLIHFDAVILKMAHTGDKQDALILNILPLELKILIDVGTVVLGKLESGSICKGQQLVMMPNKVVDPR